MTRTALMCRVVAHVYAGCVVILAFDVSAEMSCVFTFVFALIACG